jgi:hypothetical protein
MQYRILAIRDNGGIVEIRPEKVSNPSFSSSMGIGHDHMNFTLTEPKCSVLSKDKIAVFLTRDGEEPSQSNLIWSGKVTEIVPGSIGATGTHKEVLRKFDIKGLGFIHQIQDYYVSSPPASIGQDLSTVFTGLINAGMTGKGAYTVTSDFADIEWQRDSLSAARLSDLLREAVSVGSGSVHVGATATFGTSLIPLLYMKNTEQTPTVGLSLLNERIVSSQPAINTENLATQIIILTNRIDHPNLAYNGSFEISGNTNTVNRQANGGFESGGTGHQQLGSSQRINTSGPTPAHSGSWFYYFNATGDGLQTHPSQPAYQISATPGKSYTLRFYGRSEVQQFGGPNGKVFMRIIYRDAGYTALQTDSIECRDLSNALYNSTSYYQFSLTSTAPAGTTLVTYELVAANNGSFAFSNGDGFLVDDIELLEVGSAIADGWELLPDTGTTFSSNWQDSRAEPTYGIRALWLQTSGNIILRQAGGHKFPVTAGEQLIFWIKVNNAGTSAPTFSMNFQQFDSDNASLGIQSIGVTGTSVVAPYQTIAMTVNVLSNAAFGHIYLNFVSAGEILIDSIAVRNSSYFTGSNLYEYVEGSRNAISVRATDIDIAYSQVEVDYGIIEKVVETDYVTNHTNAIAYATQWFKTNGFPTLSHDITLNNNAKVWQVGTMANLLDAEVNYGYLNDLQNQLVLKELTYGLTENTPSVSLLFGDFRRDYQQLLIDRERKRIGNNGVKDSISVPTTSGASVVAGAGSNAEVVAARTSDTHGAITGATYPSLKDRLEALALYVSGISGSGGSSVARATYSLTTSCANATDVYATAVLAKGGILYKLTASHDCYVSLHPTSALRTADALRPRLSTPSGSSGVIAHFNLLAGVPVYLSAPTPYANGDTTPTDSIYVRIWQNTGSTQSVVLSFVHAAIE